METVQPSVETSNEVRTEPSISPKFQWPAVRTFFNRRWWWTTLLVLAGILLLVRLGIWQLDRRDQRRARNAEIVAQLAVPPISLNDEPLPADLSAVKNRLATATGEYDLSRQVALTNQVWSTTPGFHLVTPLVLGGEVPLDGRPVAVLVDRGWLPAAQLAEEDWNAYDVVGPVEVTGNVKLSQPARNAGSVGQRPAGPKREWYRVDISVIETQLPYALLPVYLQETPSGDGSAELPFTTKLDHDLSEGNHFSYAIQWFIFAAILAVGYVYFVGKRTVEG
jgi:cytochrome oxidase assembly protein ShyY1